jgi:uncharacterized integral membrane protein
MEKNLLKTTKKPTAKPKTATATKPKPKTASKPKAKTTAKPKTTTKPKPQVNYTAMRKGEQKVAQEYWNNYGASCFAMFVVTLTIVFFLIFALANKNPVHFALFLVGLLNVFFLFELVRVIMDSGQKRKMEVVGSFDKTARSADSFLMRTGYVTQKIGKQTLIFPPQIYFAMQKGDYVQVFCTPIFRIVVSCEKISRK